MVQVNLKVTRRKCVLFGCRLIGGYQRKVCYFSLWVNFNFKVKEVLDEKSNLLVILLVKWDHYDYDHIESLMINGPIS